MKFQLNKSDVVLFIISGIIGLLLFAGLNQMPPLWFDEGWIMSVARNWVERGYYGQLLNGKPTPATMLNVGFPAVGSIALSFSIFGVGAWQGRLPSALFTVGSFILIYHLGKYLYDRRIAIATLLVALLVPSFTVHPIIFGRLALGEMTAMFYLLAGYCCLLLAWRHALWILFAALFWGLAMVTKQQVVPFLILALVIPLGLLVITKAWKQAAIMAAGLITTLIVFQFLLFIQRTLVGADLPPETKTELYLTTAFVPMASVRLRTLLSHDKTGFSHRSWPGLCAAEISQQLATTVP